MQPLICLVGANAHDRATICHATGESMHVEAVESVIEISLPTLAGAHVFLVWDDEKSIGQLKSRLCSIDHRPPIVMIGEQPSVRHVARALVSGAVDFLEWPCSSRALVEAVTSAMQLTTQALPLKERAIEARRLLERLSERERQVLTAMAQGMSNNAIAELLEITPPTVDSHRNELLSKIDATHAAEAIRLELEASLAPEWEGRFDWMAPWQIDTRRRSAN